MRFGPRPKPGLSPEIRREIGETKGRYVAGVGGGEAELTYSIASPKLIIADHTGVPETAKGTGIGQALVARLVEDARAEGVRIIALCPFVKATARRHPEWADVVS